MWFRNELSSLAEVSLYSNTRRWSLSYIFRVHNNSTCIYSISRIMRISLFPTFNQTGKQIWKGRTGVPLCPYVKYRCQCANCHKNSKPLNNFLCSSHVPIFSTTQKKKCKKIHKISFMTFRKAWFSVALKFMNRVTVQWDGGKCS